MNRRLRIAVLVSMAFGLIAAYGVYDFMRQQRRAVDEIEQSMQNVVVAAREISAGTALEPEMLKLVRYPRPSLPAGHFSSPAALRGKTVAGDVVAGELLLESRLTDGRGAILTTLLRPGFRAMAVKVNEIIGVSGFIAPNDRVDVIVSLDPPGKNGSRGKIAKVVLQDKRVLSVAQTVEGTKDGKPKLASSITLELTPDEAEKLSLATVDGQVLLALRAANDRDVVETRGSTVADFVPAPRKGRAAYTVEVYRGSERSVVTF